MLHDIDFDNAMTPHFFRASIKDGWIEVPPLPVLGACRMIFTSLVELLRTARLTKKGATVRFDSGEDRLLDSARS